MTGVETYTLHGICLRLIHALAPGSAGALILARWIVGRSEIFGPMPPIVPTGRRMPGVDPDSWQMIGACIMDRVNVVTEPPDQTLRRLRIIAALLGLSSEEGVILRFLALQQRQGPVAEFAVMLKREIGLSDEAMISWCCNLDAVTTWAALAPQGRLVTLGLVQTDSTLTVLRDDPYTLSGLLLALIQPPAPEPRGGLGTPGQNSPYKSLI